MEFKLEISGVHSRDIEGFSGFIWCRWFLKMGLGIRGGCGFVEDLSSNNCCINILP